MLAFTPESLAAMLTQAFEDGWKAAQLTEGQDIVYLDLNDTFECYVDAAHCILDESTRH